MAEADPKLPHKVNVHEAKTHFSKLLERAHAGETIEIAKAGRTYALLVPATIAPKPPRRQPGALKHLGPLPDDIAQSAMDAVELDAWEAALSSS